MYCALLEVCGLKISVIKFLHDPFFKTLMNVIWENTNVCQRTDVVQTGQVGWMVLILQWKMVKFPGMSAVAIVLQVADLNLKF